MFASADNKHVCFLRSGDLRVLGYAALADVFASNSNSNSPTPATSTPAAAAVTTNTAESKDSKEAPSAEAKTSAAAAAEKEKEKEITVKALCWIDAAVSADHKTAGSDAPERVSFFH